MVAWLESKLVVKMACGKAGMMAVRLVLPMVEMMAAYLVVKTAEK